MIRRLTYLLSVVIIAAAVVLVPLPLIVFAPGEAVAIPELVEADTTTTPIDGELSLLTIRLSQPTTVGTVQAWLSSTRDLVRYDRVIPAGVEEGDFFEAETHRFTREFRIAAGVALREAGFADVRLSTAVLVAAVLPQGPSARTLRTGDIVLALEGEPVDSAEDLVSRLRSHEVGDEVRLSVERDDETLGLQVTIGTAEGMERPGLGVAVDTIARDVTLPFDVRLAQETGIGGPSAGLMFALTIYDLVSEDDVARGRHIVGTGTIEPDGTVGPISGIQEKVATATRAGATVMLVPATQVDEARAVAPASLELIGVTTLRDALDALAR